MIGNDPVWIEVDCVGENTGKKYFARFRVKKYLTHKERADAVRVAESLCVGINQELVFRTLLSSIAFLNQHILECDADWWRGEEDSRIGQVIKGLDLLDENPIWTLSKQLNDAQKPAESTAPKE